MRKYSRYYIEVTPISEGNKIKGYTLQADEVDMNLMIFKDGTAELVAGNNIIVGVPFHDAMIDICDEIAKFMANPTSDSKQED